MTGTHNLRGTGNMLANLIVGNAGNNTLDGGMRVEGSVDQDTLVGGMGNDTYLLRDAGNVVVEDVAAGIDTIRLSVTGRYSFTMQDNVENLVLLSGTGSVVGNAGWKPGVPSDRRRRFKRPWRRAAHRESARQHHGNCHCRCRRRRNRRLPT
ncbi:hypothetical protein [Paracoccus laeviglucosivorans]|uniref:hypothetical protein n=1 Tax=Paracoccus laeviglucosivorans TaxID=1197861 RepID=UPI00115886C2|nr:hypothetical protein [Paracoccus laeviglucosivorans]